MSELRLRYEMDASPRASQFVTKLEEAGFAVWPGGKVPPGKSFEQAVREALAETSRIVVRWAEVSTRKKTSRIVG